MLRCTHSSPLVPFRPCATRIFYYFSLFRPAKFHLNLTVCWKICWKIFRPHSFLYQYIGALPTGKALFFVSTPSILAHKKSRPGSSEAGLQFVRLVAGVDIGFSFLCGTPVVDVVKPFPSDFLAQIAIAIYIRTLHSRIHISHKYNMIPAN